ncbi:MAG: hypothetical protein H6935_10900 [Thiobacillus sp.]|nr:hypothetical protein [Thiobacillus sp.]
MAERFGTFTSDNVNSPNIFVYHVDLGERSQLNYRDVAFDASRYDYEVVIDTFLKCIHSWLTDYTVYLVTQINSPLKRFASRHVRVVELDLDTERPMYERVFAMCAYTHSTAFANDTLFLDSDAFLNADIRPYLEADFDVAITTRDIPGLMPVNEGVIIARSERTESVKAFFLRYLSTYEALAEDSATQTFYGDIRKWRGGQLSLNAITYNVAPFSPYRTLSIDGTRIRPLPCEVFNYSHEYGASLRAEKLNEKIFVHLKGSRKDVIEQFRAYIERRKASSEFLQPQFAMFNKMYREAPFTTPDSRTAFANHLVACAQATAANTPGSSALLADDQFVWFRNLGFLTDLEFTSAFAPYREDSVLRARIWRVYMLCWAARTCMNLPGDFVDLGCYDGRTVDIVSRYIRFEKSNKHYYLYDLFDNPTPESRKSAHGPNLYGTVCDLFADRINVHVISGAVPHSFQKGLPDHIAFAQIDLNEADAEIAALEILFDRVVPGGILILDDYGFKRYAESHIRETEFFSSRSHFVFESPTGQGLVIKRS